MVPKTTEKLNFSKSMCNPKPFCNLTHSKMPIAGTPIIVLYLIIIHSQCFPQNIRRLRSDGGGGGGGARKRVSGCQDIKTQNAKLAKLLMHQREVFPCCFGQDFVINRAVMCHMHTCLPCMCLSRTLRVIMS